MQLVIRTQYPGIFKIVMCFCSFIYGSSGFSSGKLLSAVILCVHHLFRFGGGILLHKLSFLMDLRKSHRFVPCWCFSYCEM